MIKYYVTLNFDKILSFCKGYTIFFLYLLENIHYIWFLFKLVIEFLNLFNLFIIGN